MKVSILGAGKMAHQLGAAIRMRGHRIVELYNRSADAGRSLAAILDAEYVDNLADLDQAVDLLIIAVSDDAIEVVARLLNVESWVDTIVVHTSGSIGSAMLSRFNRYGSFYPFQSMTIGQKVDFEEVPILINASSDDGTKVLENLAYELSSKVYKITDDQRGQIHLAGVFCNNFTNHMLTLAKDLLDTNGLQFDIVKPLIANTLSKVTEINPIDAQTGPALRNDQDVIDLHIQKLSGDPRTQKIYKLLTESIQNRHQVD